MAARKKATRTRATKKKAVTPTLPRRPTWLPASVYSAFQAFESRDPNKWPNTVRPMAHRLAFDERARLFWEGEAGNQIAHNPMELWHLAEAIEIAKAGQNPMSEGFGQVGAEPGWFLLSRSKRRGQAEKIAKKARELRALVADTHFDRAAYLLLVLGGRKNGEGSRADGPMLSRLLEALGDYAETTAAKVEHEPTFSETRDQSRNFLMSVGYIFLTVRLGLKEGSGAAYDATVAVASAALDGNWFRLDAMNATRSIHTKSVGVHEIPL
jgi:hypothetical protein